MRIETLKDVLKWTELFHKQLSDCLAHCADETESERLKMLLDYLAEHEQVLSDVLVRFEATASANALNTWCYEYLDKYPIPLHADCDKPFANASPADVMASLAQQHQQVISFYRYLLSRAETPSARELLERLVGLEEHEAKRIMHSANRFEDI